MDLDFVRIECDIMADMPSQISSALYHGVRKIEGYFRSACCSSSGESCLSCALSVECPYRNVFGQGLSPDPEIVRRHQKPSVPFSLYIEGFNGDASLCTAGIVVIGSAVNYVELFHTALLQTVEECLYTLLPGVTCSVRSYSLDYQGFRYEITDAASLPECVILLSAEQIMKSSVHSGSVRLLLKSPLRLLIDGSIARHFDFARFFRSQMRRCSSLCAYYGTGELVMDFAQLSINAQNIAVFNEKIQYNQPLWSKSLNRAGLTGTIECAGLVEPMLSLLLLGSNFNAGKGASFGAGYHHIEVL